MSLESFNFIDSLNASNPTTTDNVSEGDDHIRGIKTTIKNTFPNINAAVTATDEEINLLDGVTATTAELNYVDGVTSNIQTQLGTKLPLAGGTMTGDVSLGDNVKAKFGAGDDLQIYHDGSSSVIEDSGTGHLRLHAGSLRIRNAANTEAIISGDEGGAVELFFNGSEKLATTSTGIDVTGEVEADTFVLADSTNTDRWELLRSGNDFTIYNDYPTQSEKLRITSTGNVGIGTTTPSGASGKTLALNGASGQTRIALKNNFTGDSAGDGFQILLNAGSAVATFEQREDSDISFNTDNAERMRITSTGNVGIGTTSPAVNNKGLHINNSGANTIEVHLTNSTTGTTTGDGLSIQVDGSGDAYISQREAKDIITYTNGSERMRINSSGNVGIGTTSPSGALTVKAGSINPDIIRLEASGTSRTWSLGMVSSSNSGFTIKDNLNTNRLTIDSSGNVGIGTSSPSRTLHVNSGSGNSNTIFESTDTAVTVRFKDTTGEAELECRNDFRFSNNAGANEVMRIDSSGKVGIGTSSPSVALDVRGSVKANAIYPSIEATGGTSDSSGEYWKLGSITLSGSLSAKIRVGGTQSYSSGSNIGGETTIHLRGNNSNTLLSGYFYGQTQGNSTVADVCYINTASNEFDIYIRTHSTFAGLDTWVDCAGNWTPNLANTGSTTAPTGSIALPSRFTVATNGSERMRIDSSGNVLVGTTSNTTSSKISTTASSGVINGVGVDCATTATTGAMAFFNPNGQVGSIAINGTTTAYVTSSDYRLKENVVPMTGSIDRLKALKPSEFNFITDATTTVDGFLAHEAQEVVPECATGTKDAMRDEEYEVTPAVMDGETVVTEAVMGTRSVPDYQGIDQSKLVPLLVASLQEAIARIEQLEQGA